MITDRKLRLIEPRDKPYIVSEDTKTRGEGRFQVKVYPSGKISFQMQFFKNGKKRFKVLGNYPALSLADARDKFRRESTNLQNDKDLSFELLTYGKLRKLYFKKIKDYRGFKVLSGVIERDIDPMFDDDKVVSEISIDDVKEVLSRPLSRGSRAATKILRGQLRLMIQYAIYLENSPDSPVKISCGIKHNVVDMVPYTHKHRRMDRVLNEAEVKAIWNNEKLGVNYRNFFRLQMALSGQRVRQLLLATFDEFDLEEKVFIIPKERIKMKDYSEHVVPLSELAIKIIKELKRSSSNKWVFPSPYVHNQHLSSRSLTYEFKRIEGVNEFCPRDLRRTCKTLMTKAGVPIHHRDLLQQHLKQDVATIHYDRYDYLREKREAMSIWTDFLEDIVK
ncbi:tyrosine-type recombinase/integrase [Algicola sagamiensis]|uniref:tyrosine-type recombinase/integrase n=1 Tax=Algicola sagamiensis TaxID=163869 RepID=UPI00037C70C1|nr:site-specific integrase [Algicola sagamiensis]